MNRATLLLGIGALTGVALAAAGLITGAAAGGETLTQDAAARVNHQIVRRVDYDRMITAVAGDKRSPMSEGDRRRVLDRLIEEELLVQRALELGLAQHDARVRKDLTAAILDSVAAESRNVEPSDDQLRQFYQEHQEFFAAAEQVHVRQIWFRIANLSDSNAVYERAKQALARLRQNESFEAIKAELGDREIAALPDGLLPSAKLGDYLGPTAVRAVIHLSPGQMTEPVRSSSGYHILQLVERAPAPAPPFEEIRTQVLEAYRRNAADLALRAYLDDLRSRADVQVAQDLK